MFQIVWRQPCDEMDFFPIISLAALFIPGLETKLLFLIFFLNHSGIAYRKKKNLFSDTFSSLEIFSYRKGILLPFHALCHI